MQPRHWAGPERSRMKTAGSEPVHSGTPGERPAYLALFFCSAAEMPFDKFGGSMRSNTAIHPRLPPPPKERIPPSESARGAQQKLSSLPWLPTACSVRSPPGLAFRPRVRATQTSLQTSSPGLVTSGQLFPTQTAFTSHPLSGHTHRSPDKASMFPQQWDPHLRPCVSLPESLPESACCLPYTLLSLFSHSLVFSSYRLRGLQPTGLLCPWGFPGKSTGVGCHCLLQGIFPTQGSNLGPLHCIYTDIHSCLHSFPTQAITEC